MLHVCSGDRITIHVHEIDRDRSILELGVDKHQFVRAGAKNQFLLDRIREEFDAFQVGASSIERVIIHRRRDLSHGGGIAVDVRYCLPGMDLDRRILFQNILDRIADVFRLLPVDEGDLVGPGVGQSHGLAAFIRTIACDGQGIFGDDLTFRKVWIGDLLIRSDGVMRFCIVYVMDNIAQWLPTPMRIYSGILCDLCIPVEKLIAIGGGVPAVKDIARFGGVGLQRGNPAVLRHVRPGLIDRFGVFAVHKGNSECRRSPLGVEGQVGRRHGIEYIRFAT